MAETVELVGGVIVTAGLRGRALVNHEVRDVEIAVDEVPLVLRVRRPRAPGRRLV